MQTSEILELLSQVQHAGFVVNFGTVQCVIGPDSKIQEFDHITSVGDTIKCIKVNAQTVFLPEDAVPVLFPSFTETRSMTEMPAGCGRIAAPDTDLFSDIPCEPDTIVLVLGEPKERVYGQSLSGCGFFRSSV
jgi:hypothetical protein